MIIFIDRIITFTIFIVISVVIGSVTDFDKSSSNVCKVYFLQLIVIKRDFKMGNPRCTEGKSVLRDIFPKCIRF